MRTRLAGLLIAASLIVPATAIATTTAASAATATNAVATTACHHTSTWSRPPTAATTYPAGPAGTVTVAPGPGGLKVVSVHANHAWSSLVDTPSGNSVDVYFRHLTSNVKFEVGIEGNNLMQRVVTTCK